MTQRSMLVGWSPTVVIRAGGEVQVAGWDGDRLEAATEGRWGLQLKQRRGTTEVQIGGSGVVRLPFGSAVTVYSGKSADIRGIRGSLTVYAGGGAFLREVGTIAHLSAGGMVDVTAERVQGSDVKLTAGGSLRCAIRGLRDARLLVSDLGGRWEGVIGDGRATLRLDAGGDVTLVTDQTVVAQPPHYMLGQIEQG